MTKAIISSKLLLDFLNKIIPDFDNDFLIIEYGRLSCVFDSVPIEHKGSGDFEYSINQLIRLREILNGMKEQPVNLELTKSSFKIIIDINTIN